MHTAENLISVILPVYNRGNLIDECIDSVIAQSYQNFEIVIVDDGSTDDTRAICKALADKDPRIKLYEAAHGGVSAARNIALKKATGDYIFFLDSDDVIHPFLLETLLTGMICSNAGIGATDVARASASPKSWNKVKEMLAKADHPGDVESLTAAQVIDNALVGHSPLSCIGGVMMKASLIGDTKFREDIYIGEDFYFIYENIIKGTVGVFLKQKWYYVRLHDRNSSWDYSYNGFWTRFYRRKLVWENEEKLGRANHANKEKASALYCYTLCLSKNRPYSNDCKMMRKTLIEHQSSLLPSFPIKERLVYYLSIFLPATYRTLIRFKNKLAPRIMRILKK